MRLGTAARQNLGKERNTVHRARQRLAAGQQGRGGFYGGNGRPVSSSKKPQPPGNARIPRVNCLMWQGIGRYLPGSWYRVPIGIKSSSDPRSCPLRKAAQAAFVTLQILDGRRLY